MTFDRTSPLRDHWVYRAYDRDGVLLYVGCTRNIAQRRREHRGQSQWYAFAARFRLTGPLSYVDARAEERAALQGERPVFADTPEKQSIRNRRRYAIRRLMDERYDPTAGTGDYYYALYYECSAQVDAGMDVSDLALLTAEADYLAKRKATAA